MPDTAVFDLILELLGAGGEKAVAFSSVARGSGLAAATLAQRFGTRDGMVQQALLHYWNCQDLILRDADAEIAQSPKGAIQLLKTLRTDPVLYTHSQRDKLLRDRATVWRNALEQALLSRVGEGASALFMLWQGQIAWAGTGGRALRVKDMVKLVT